MRFALGFPGLNLYPPSLQPWEEPITSEQLVAIARHAEAVGFDYLAVSDHLLMSGEMARAPMPRFSGVRTTKSRAQGFARKRSRRSARFYADFRMEESCCRPAIALLGAFWAA